MNKKLKIIFSLLIFFLIFFILIILYNLLNTESIIEDTCIQDNLIDSLDIDGCYDAYSSNIYMQFYFKKNIPKIQKIGINFFDFSNKYYIVSLNKSHDTFSYKVNASRKPLYINIIFEDLKNDYCISNKSLTIDYCSSELSAQSINASINLITEAQLSDFQPIDNQENDDTISITLLDKNSTWASTCFSIWECSSWEECKDGIQKRNCIDKNNCIISTNVPKKTKYCNGSCEEDWVCDWSECKNGYSTPICVDQNDCGTDYNKPTRILCDNECSPDIYCGEWSNCSVDYNFNSLNNLYNGKLNGIKSRKCIDQNNCINGYIQKKNCSTSVDIDVVEFSKCGENYIGIYNLLNNSLIAVMKKDSSTSQAMSIDFTNNIESSYCPYCYNRILDGDETEIDCGGSCKKCAEKTVIKSFDESAWEKLKNFVINMIS